MCPFARYSQSGKKYLVPEKKDMLLLNEGVVRVRFRVLCVRIMSRKNTLSSIVWGIELVPMSGHGNEGKHKIMSSFCRYSCTLIT